MAKLVDESCEDARAGARDGMAERYRAAIGVEPLTVEVQIALAREQLRRESLV